MQHPNLLETCFFLAIRTTVLIFEMGRDAGEMEAVSTGQDG